MHSPDPDNSDDDDGVPHLSAAAMSALQEFYSEQEKIRNILSSDEKQSESESTPKPVLFKNELSACFPEDWQMSQFWYDEETSAYLSKKVKELAAGESEKVACVSCPSVFRACGISPNVHLFEFDKRFSAFGPSYFYYDYNFPSSIPEECFNAYSVVIVDPPFLAKECLEKVSETVKKISKDGAKILLCTGVIMEKEAELLLSLKKTSFIPRHKNNLGNDFACYSNFDLNIS